MIRLISTFAVAALMGTLVGRGVQEPPVTEADRVQKDVETVARAVYSGDLETALRFTHRAIIQLLGGRDAARAAMSKLAAQLAETRMKLESFTFPGAPEFLEAGGRRFAIVPTLSIIEARGQRFESLNFQFGVLEPGAEQWTFIEGSRINTRNVQLLFPGFPEAYEFPPIYRKKL